MIERKSLHGSFLKIALLAIVLCFAPAIGGSPVALSAPAAKGTEATVQSWLDEWRDLGSAVSTKAVDYDAKTDTVRIQNLVIAPAAAVASAPRTQLTVARVEIRAAASAADAIVTESLHLEGIMVEFGGATLRIAKLDLRGVRFPLANPSTAPGRPSGTMNRLGGEIERMECAHLESDGIEVAPTDASTSAGIRIARLLATDLRAGTVDRLDVTELVSGRPDFAGAFRIGQIGLRRLAISELASVFDPRTYDGNAATRLWKVAGESLSLKSLASTGAGGNVTLADMMITGLRVRRLPFDPSATLSAAARDPEYFSTHRDEAGRFFEGLFDSIALDRFEARNFTADDGTATPKKRTHFDEVAVAGIDAHRVGRVGLRGLHTQDGSAGLGLARLDVTELLFPTRASAAAATPPTTARGPASVTVTSIATATAEGFNLVAPGITADIRAGRLETSDWVGALPGRFAFALEGISIPVAAIPDQNLKATLTEIELAKIAADLDVGASWDEVRGQLTIDRVDLTVADLGKLSLGATFGGVSRALFEKPETIPEHSADMSLVQARLVFVNGGMVERVLNRIATANNQSPDQIRKALTANMPTIFGAISDASVRNRLIFAAISFLNSPKSLEVKSVPQAPIAFSDITTTARDKPTTLPSLLKLEASAGERR